MMFKTVVVPIDGTELSRLALPMAGRLAVIGRAGLRLVAVARDDDGLARCRESLQEAAGSLPTTAAVDLDVIVGGDAVGALLGLGGEVDQGLWFGRHKHNHAVSELLGTVGSKLVERATRPFVVVGPTGPQEATGSDVVVAVDGGDDADPLLATAAAWAAHLGAPLRIVTVYEPVPADIRRPDHYTRRHGPSSDPDRYLDDLRHRVDEPAVPTVTTVAIPDPVGVADGLARYVHEHPALLLVVGTARRHRWTSSVLRGLLHRSPQPVLVAPSHTE
jgi:nucleotide-binding universal stress UspA family protein